MQSDNLHQVEGRKSALRRQSINSKNKCRMKGARRRQIRGGKILVIHVFQSNDFITDDQVIFSK